ncbi:MAG: DEAD/DEAH box helicase family protein [Thermoanaerobaculia bacterium]
MLCADTGRRKARGYDYPNTALLKLRQFIERLAQLSAARFGFDAELSLNELIRGMSFRTRNRGVIDSFHLVRGLGNQASHQMTGTSGQAIHALRAARSLAAWYYRMVVDRGFKPGAFVTPKPPADPAAALREQLAEMAARLGAERQRAASAEEEAALAEEARRLAEADAKAALGDAEAALALAEESAHEKTRHLEHLARIRSDSEAADEEARQELFERSSDAAAVVTFDEAQTRQLIDLQLREAGWEADSETLRHGRGVRPQKGRDLAIAEWPTATGPADYVLFRGLVPLGVVEAKRSRKNVASAIGQAKRYSRGFDVEDGTPSPGGPWQDFRVPFLFATNGRPFLRQLQVESGIWFHDARRATNHPRALQAWYSPEGLADLLRIDAEAADAELADTPSDYLPLRDYQHDAVGAVEAAIARGQREILVAMATGSGKTRTCIGLLYRLIKAHRFRRALFVVDRSALGDQAGEAFKELDLEASQSFADCYDVKELGDVEPDSDTRLHFATVQSLVRRILYRDQDSLPVDAYDVIVVDECHRGYNLDRELSAAAPPACARTSTVAATTRRSSPSSTRWISTPASRITPT